ncbi:MAG TPA: hypothetical protein VFS30_06230 [Dehalococcoidia bacterium]|nr:hypothetical protein [Dehalococcoidia bacterium]
MAITTEDKQAIEKIARDLGEDKGQAARLVGQYGAAASLVALEWVVAQRDRGYHMDSPIGLMFAKLKRGAFTQAVREETEAKAGGSAAMRDYCAGQANPQRDTAAKRLARAVLDGELGGYLAAKGMAPKPAEPVVPCAGCGGEHSAIVTPAPQRRRRTA